MVQALFLHPAVLVCVSGSSCYSIVFLQSLPFTAQTTVTNPERTSREDYRHPSFLTTSFSHFHLCEPAPGPGTS